MTSTAADTGRLALVILLVFAGSACDEGRPTQPEGPLPQTAKGGPSVTVSAADPAYGEQGTVGLAVRVLGSGFDQQSVASWERDGAPDTKITVRSTAFVSSTELRTVIDIAPDAVVDLYDIAVRTGGGRKGIGTERFEVTLATSIGALGSEGALPRGINGQGMVTGVSPIDRVAHGFVWTQAGGMEDLGGPGTPWDIDEAGLTVVGGRASTDALLWSRGGSGWSIGTLPITGYTGGAARAVASDGAGLGFLVGGFVRRQLKGRSTADLPALWTRTGAGWSLAVLSTGPYASGVVLDVTANGVAVGRGQQGTAFSPLVWENPTEAATVLPGTPAHLVATNSTATVAVGQADLNAAYWYRAAPGAGWLGPVLLDRPAVACDGVANDVNDDGLVVGKSCGKATAWRISGGTVVQRVVLGGLGPNPGENSSAEAVNASGLAAGHPGVVWAGFSSTAPARC